MSARLTVGSADAVVQLVGTTTVSGGAVDSVSFTGLNLRGVNCYKLFATIIDDDGGADVRICFNADTTSTNYRREAVEAADGGITANRVNNNYIGAMLSDAGNSSLLEATFKQGAATQGTCIWQFGHGSSAAPSHHYGMLYWIPTTAVTSIRIDTNGSTEIDDGSTFSLYKYI